VEQRLAHNQEAVELSVARKPVKDRRSADPDTERADDAFVSLPGQGAASRCASRL
jgi:hypothetical protein